ncbi:MAG: M15 family metallopeptidase [Gallionella sp.]|jgi:D-alanyl-D-alanine dipeptidase|nr:M15 family metallopeptidase [Gallionella sp.]
MNLTARLRIVLLGAMLFPGFAWAEYPTAKLLLDTSKTVAKEEIQYPAGETVVNSAIVHIPPGTSTGWHHHGIPNFAYVLSGQVEVEYADHTRRIYKQGDAFMEAIHMKHIGANTGTEPTEILVVNMGIAGKPHVFVDAPPKDPPVLDGASRKTELVSLLEIDPRLRLDIRYATPNNFSGKPAYANAAAYMQLPAALALKAANDQLHATGYGLVIFDAYRPWQVTRSFWDSFPQYRAYLADPLQGSRHNRGCAVDLGLFDLNTGAMVPMPSDYDDFTERADPDYAGGSAAQRAARNLLRQAMETHEFRVYPNEWWHFDFKDWAEYPVLNLSFEDLSAAAPTK